MCPSSTKSAARPATRSPHPSCGTYSNSPPAGVAWAARKCALPHSNGSSVNRFLRKSRSPPPSRVRCQVRVATACVRYGPYSGSPGRRPARCRGCRGSRDRRSPGATGRTRPGAGRRPPRRRRTPVRPTPPRRASRPPGPPSWRERRTGPTSSSAALAGRVLASGTGDITGWASQWAAVRAAGVTRTGGAGTGPRLRGGREARPADRRPPPCPPAPCSPEKTCGVP